MYEKYAKIERIKKMMDKVAYCSLILDVCIAIVTTLSIFGTKNPQIILIPINYMLTIVVILSISLFITLFILKHEEAVLDKLLNRKYQYKPKSNSLLNKIKIQ
jgi:hypothetical protein